MQVDEKWNEKNVTVPQVFFKHFASKNQLPGFSVSGTLVENGLKYLVFMYTIVRVGKSEFCLQNY